MRPGDDCTRCHGFVISGTVFPTAHEPTGCYGSAGVQVLITDSNDMLFSFTANAAGSFFGDPFPGPTYPLHVKVIESGRRGRCSPDPLNAYQAHCSFDGKPVEGISMMARWWREPTENDAPGDGELHEYGVFAEPRTGQVRVMRYALEP